MKIKYIICFFIILSFAVGLSSCSFIVINGGDDTEAPAPDTSSAVTDTESESFVRVPDGAKEAKKKADALVAALPSHKFANDSLSIAAAPGIDLAPADPADEYEDALIERNKTVEAKYGINVLQIETPLDLMLSDAYSAYLSGSFYADAMLIPQKAVGEFLQKGFLLNSQSIPHVDFNKEYFDADAMSQASAGYASPVIAGSATKDIGSYYCVYVNTALLGEEGEKELRETVKNGSWTWDELIGTARAVSALNGNVGMIGSGTEGILVDTVYLSSGQHYLDTGYQKIPAMAFETETTLKIIGLLRTMYDSGAVFDSGAGSGSEIDEFRKGNVLFHADTVNNMSEVARMGAGWTVLPVPKLDPEQETYLAYCSPDAPVMVVPAGNPDTADAGYAIEALNAASYGYLDRCYYNRLVRTSVNNSRTLDMIDYIGGVKAGRGVYDFTSMYGGVFDRLAFNTSETVRELAVKGGDIAVAAYNSRYDMNWRFVNAFPMSKDR
ncbi:MAG: extracellular solute-binding protein [Clostridia bacterium]|nr:extracellular solute-binding protein [Clostridia bacterium]